MNKELLAKLPASWNDINLKQFQDLSTLTISEEADGLASIENSISLISKFTGEPVEAIEGLTMKELNPLCQKIAFMMQPFQPFAISSLVTKEIEEISFDDFILFTNTKDYLTSLHKILKALCKGDLTEDYILNLSIVDCLNAFEVVKKKLKLYLSLSIKLEKMKIVKFKILRIFKGKTRK